MHYIKNITMPVSPSSPIHDGRYGDIGRPANSTTTITIGEVTWTANQPIYPVLTLNGDWQMPTIPGLTITPTSPGWDGEKHGTMVNIDPVSDQGFDSRMPNVAYDAALNAGTGPIDCSTPKSIMSAVSYDAPADPDVVLKSVEVLTVVDQCRNTLRPGYSGDDKSFCPTEADLDYSVLGNFEKSGVTSKPDIAVLHEDFQKPIIEFRNTDVGLHTHPFENMPDYGREIAKWLEKGTLMLQLNYTPAEKRDLLIRMTQIAVDLRAAMLNGQWWTSNGGHHSGRKGVLYLGAKVLNDQVMLDFCNHNLHPTKFPEDGQHFYIAQSDVDLARYQEPVNPRQRDPYTSEMIGDPEWGENHWEAPQRDGSNWNVKYRTIAGCSMLGTALLVHLMNGKSDWNHPAFFDYYEDRYWGIEEVNRGTTNGPQLFTASMWDQHGVNT